MKDDAKITIGKVLTKVYIIVLCVAVGLLYRYVSAHVAIGVGMYFILSQLNDIYQEVAEMKGEQDSLWKSILSIRKPF